jgi:hypothetical protein
MPSDPKGYAEQNERSRASSPASMRPDGNKNTGGGSGNVSGGTGGRDGAAAGGAVPSQTAAMTNAKLTRFAKLYRTEMAAGASSVLSTAVAYPLDSIKSRMQTYPYKNTMQCIMDTYRNERLAGFWRGSYPPLLFSFAPVEAPLLVNHTEVGAGTDFEG